jgi:hypothetical protein
LEHLLIGVLRLCAVGGVDLVDWLRVRAGLAPAIPTASTTMLGAIPNVSGEACPPREVAFGPEPNVAPAFSASAV